MRILLAGATGGLGRRLVPLLVSDGHHVFGMTRTPSKADSLRAAGGAEPVIADALDRGAVTRSVAQANPDVIVDEVTSLATMRNLKNFDAARA